MRVSVSKIDGWLYYMRSEHKTFDEFRADLMGESPQTPEMLMGQTFHEIFEHAKPGMAADSLERNGFTFIFDCDCEVPVSGVPEVRCQRTYEVDNELVTVRGRADNVLGSEVCDYKMVPRYDESKYVQFQDSFQWRAYLDMLNAEQFRYRLFVKKPKNDGVHIVDTHTLLFHRYPGMHRDVKNTVREFLQFVKQYVPEWYEKQKAKEQKHGVG